MATDRRPNVLIFCADMMRADALACAGNPNIHTPNLDRLAACGMLFTRSYCNNPICMPARTTMFTGLLPRDHGARMNCQTMRSDLPTLPQVLADNGYRTHAAGKLHLSPWGMRHNERQATGCSPECLTCWGEGLIRQFPEPYFGLQTVDFVGGHVSYVYGEYLDWLRAQGGDPALLAPAQALEPPTGAPDCYKAAIPKEWHYNRYIADSTIGLLNECADSGQPFFAWCSFPDPHTPSAPPRPFCDIYDPQSMPLPVRSREEVDTLPPFYPEIYSGALRPYGTNSHGISDAHWQEQRAFTYGMITHIDEEIGRVLDALDALGLSDNTVIMLTADHGEMQGDHGLLLFGPYTFQGSIRIPTIVAAPGMPGRRSSDALICQLDLLPSVLDFCGIPMPGSNWPDYVIEGVGGLLRPLSNYPGKSWRGLLDGSVAAIRDSVVIENDDPSLGFNIRCLVTDTHRLTIYPGTPDGELFDLQNDPYELHNLWYDPEHAALRQELLVQLLDRYAQDTPAYPVPETCS